MHVLHVRYPRHLTNSAVHDWVQGEGRMEGGGFGGVGVSLGVGVSGVSPAPAPAPAPAVGIGDGVAVDPRSPDALHLFILLLASVTLLVLTLVMLLWLKGQMLQSKKQKDCEEAGRPSSPESQPALSLPSSHSPPTSPLSPPPVPPVTPRTPHAPHTPPPSPHFTQPFPPSPPSPLTATPLSSTPPEAAPSQPVASTPTVVPAPPRTRAKGLLERRGSSASLTIDLHPSQDTVTSLPAPTRECTTEEFLLSAGNLLSRAQLRSCLRDTRALHREFWDIPSNHCERVEVAGSGVKNRYRSILPNEHSRVRLISPSPTEDLVCYINANYIKGYDGEESAYIATQGPLPHTVADFWLMVWEQNAPAIVMITKLQEKARPKCEAYLPPDPVSDEGDVDSPRCWKELEDVAEPTEGDTEEGEMEGEVAEADPDPEPAAGEAAGLCDSSDLDGPIDLEDDTLGLDAILEPQSPARPQTPGSPMTFGDITVAVTKVKHNEGYVVREVRVQRGDEVRTLLHYWYDTWPDHKTPPSAQCLVALALEVEQLRCVSDAAGPVVVHCSAGIGRTGCFIAVSIGTNQLVQEDAVDVLGIVCRLRHDRGGMVQTAEQYEFVHRALALFERSLPDKRQ